MDKSEMIRVLDKKYSGAGAVKCPNEGKTVPKAGGGSTEEHGALSVHGTGAYLLCGVCGYNEPVGRPS